MESKFDLSDFIATLTVEKARSNLVDRFRTRRKEMGYSQRKLAALSGVSYASIRRFETMGEISLSSLLSLADSLGYLADFEALFVHSHIRSLKDIS
jgi:transcriptional regulator with XRE-family HTH domain